MTTTTKTCHVKGAKFFSRVNKINRGNKNTFFVFFLGLIFHFPTSIFLLRGGVYFPFPLHFLKECLLSIESTASMTDVAIILYLHN